MRIVIFFILLSISLTSCQEFYNQPKIREHIGKDTADISKFVHQTNKYKLFVDSIKNELKSIQLDIYESTESGIKTLFYNQTDTLKKEIIYYGETGKRIVATYQEEGLPILIEDTEIKYKNPICTDSNVEYMDSITNVYYLKNKKLVYWIKNAKIMPQLQYEMQEKNIVK